MTENEELQLLKKENSKLKLESRLRKSLSLELERQKGIVQAAKEAVSYTHLTLPTILLV